MTILMWNDGMSVGIDAIDEDHKNIIAIIAKLSCAKNEDASKQTITAIFTELEHSIVTHFGKEEELLEQSCYADIIAHKANHQKFIEQLPILKKEWLTENCRETSDRIIAFLQQWIVNDILVEDLNYSSSVKTMDDLAYNRDKNHQSRPSAIGKMSSFLSKK